VGVLFKSMGGDGESLKSSQTITGQKLDLIKAPPKILLNFQA
jgi:hypothetical protein